MTQLLIPDVAENLLQQLRERAARQGRSVETEARIILENALRPDPATAWTEIDAFRQRLAASGRTFSDSTELIREDRER
ncbi:MAG: FitA-like ribbon-helix-helix domain-containing protein [Gemmataceae bacterium]